MLHEIENTLVPFFTQYKKMMNLRTIFYANIQKMKFENKIQRLNIGIKILQNNV